MNSIAIAGRRKIVLIVDGAAVDDIRNDLQSPTLFTYVAVGIEFNVRWRLLRNFPFLVCHVIAIKRRKCDPVRPRIHGSLDRLPIFRTTALASWDRQRIRHCRGLPTRGNRLPRRSPRLCKTKSQRTSLFLFSFCLPHRDRFRAQVNFHGPTSFACDSRHLDMTHGVRPDNSYLHDCPRTGTMRSWHQHFRILKNPNP
jgi:hypothetical protein